MSQIIKYSFHGKFCIQCFVASEMLMRCRKRFDFFFSPVFLPENHFKNHDELIPFWKLHLITYIRNEYDSIKTIIKFNSESENPKFAHDIRLYSQIRDIQFNHKRNSEIISIDLSNEKKKLQKHRQKILKWRKIPMGRNVAL